MIGPSPAPSIQLQCTTLISSAQILALYTSPVVVVPAPAANQLVILDEVVLQIVNNTVVYGTATSLALQWTGSGIAACTAPSVALLSSASIGAVDITHPGSTTTVLEPKNTLSGLGISLVGTGGANPTGGNGSLIITSFYKLVNLS